MQSPAHPSIPESMFEVHGSRSCSAYRKAIATHLSRVLPQFHAWLRSSQGTSSPEVYARMHDVLAVMGLWRVRNTPVRIYCLL